MHGDNSSNIRKSVQTHKNSENKRLKIPMGTESSERDKQPMHLEISCSISQTHSFVLLNNRMLYFSTGSLTDLIAK